MDNKKDDNYYLKKIITDLSFILKNTEGLTLQELKGNDVLVDSVMFRLIQISENSDKLTEQLKTEHSLVPWRAMKGMRNRIVHEYGNVDMTVIYDTIKNDIPKLVLSLKEIVK